VKSTEMFTFGTPSHPFLYDNHQIPNHMRHQPLVQLIRLVLR